MPAVLLHVLHLALCMHVKADKPSNLWPKLPVKVSLLSLHWQESKQQADRDKCCRPPATDSFANICACSLHESSASSIRSDRRGACELLLSLLLLKERVQALQIQHLCCFYISCFPHKKADRFCLAM